MQDLTSLRMESPDMQEKLDEIRNKVAKRLGNWANRVSVSMYIPVKVERVEGEQWEEDGKRWEMKNGVKTSISPLALARMPIWCPRCSHPMNHKFDRKFYYLRGWCYDCNITWEAQLRREGKFEAFERRMMRENEKSFLRDKLTEYDDYIRTFTLPQAHYENGTYETLASLNVFQPLFDEILADAAILIARLEAIAQEEQHELEGTSESGPELHGESVESDDSGVGTGDSVGDVSIREDAGTGEGNVRG